MLSLLSLSLLHLSLLRSSLLHWPVLCVQGLAAFLKAIGYLIPLMDNLSANYYTREVMLILIREFQSPDEEMKKIVLKVSIPTNLHGQGMHCTRGEAPVT